MNPIRFSPFPELETHRLYLRKMDLDDVNEVFALRSSKNVSKFIDRPLAGSKEDARVFINNINGGMNMDKWVFWAICLKENPALVGTICLWNFRYKPLKADVGYELLPDFHGRGIMQEALHKVVDYGFNTLKLSLTEAYTHAENTNSIKLLERANFVKERFFQEKHSSKTKMVDMVVYSLKNYG